MGKQPDSVSLKDHFDALRAADRLMITRENWWRFQESRWIKEKFALHNDLLNKWQAASERDRGNFVTIEAFNALESAFAIYKDSVTAANAITAQALALAEGNDQGKSRGFADVRTAVSFVAGVVVAIAAGVGVWVALRGYR